MNFLIKTLIVTMGCAGLTAGAMAQTGDFSISSRSFKTIYNKYRVAQPKNIPWAGSYWAFARNGIADREGRPRSPAENYDIYTDNRWDATNWEKENHSCENVSEELKEGCMGWWGHCNAWAGAAIKEKEPRKEIKAGDIKFGVADQKAYLTEMWMNSGSLFAGNTNKSVKTKKAWVCDPDHPTAQEDNGWGATNYDAFWDVSPRDTLYVFSSYIGRRGQGVVIDRFSGDQVWNQPITGYRIHPIQSNDYGASEEVGNRTLYPVSMTMTIYWANDGVWGSHLSAPFDVNTIDDDLASNNNDARESYTARNLRFTLFFDKPLVMQGDKVKSVGRIVGKGIWYNQENCKSPALSTGTLDQGHPDFIWQPTSLTYYGTANPYIDPDTVYEILAGQVDDDTDDPGDDPDDEDVAGRIFTLQLSKAGFSSTSKKHVKRAVKKAFKRVDVATWIYLSSVSVSGSQIQITVKFPNEDMTESRMNSILADSGHELLGATLEE